MLNKLIKTLCVSCWTAYILQDDTRSLQYQVNAKHVDTPAHYFTILEVWEYFYSLNPWSEVRLEECEVTQLVKIFSVLYTCVFWSVLLSNPSEFLRKCTVIDRTKMSIWHWRNDNNRWKLKYWGKPCPSTDSHHKFHTDCLGMILGLHDERPATNRRSHVVAPACYRNCRFITRFIKSHHCNRALNHLGPSYTFTLCSFNVHLNINLLSKSDSSKWFSA